MMTQDYDAAEQRARDSARLADQNDAFRKKQLGGGQGKWVHTAAIEAMGQAFVTACYGAVATYDAFAEDHDPYCTHEMGVMEVQGHTVWWKIDLYDQSYDGGSPEPLSLFQTRRVLTVLFPSDY